MRISGVLAGYAAVVIVSAVTQLVLGAQIMMLLIFVGISSAAILPLTKAKLRVTDALYLAMVAYTGTLSLIIKSLLGQPLQSNLADPGTSSSYLAIGFASVTLGYIASRKIRVRSARMNGLELTFARQEFLARIAKPTFLLGFLLYSAHTGLRSNAINGEFEEGGFGGFGEFYFLIPLGVACQCALCALRPQSILEKNALLFMSLLIFALSMASNVKKVLIDLIFVIVATFLSYGIKIRIKYIFAGLFAAGLVILYVQPLIQITRTQIASLSPLERIQTAWTILEDADFDPAKLNLNADKITEGYSAFNQSYVYPSTWNVERFTMILPTDEVVRGLPNTQTMGLGDVVQEVAQATLPSLLITKSNVTTPDLIAWQFGFRTNGSISRPVVGLVASSAAAYGLAGVVFLPAIGILIAFTLIDLAAGSPRRNPWAICVLAATIQLAEKEFGQIMAYFPRQMVVIVLVGFILKRVAGGAGGPPPAVRNLAELQRATRPSAAR